MKILLPDTIELDPDLPEGWEAVVVDARAPIPPEHHDAQALVAWAASRRHLASAAADLPDLRLVQSLSAGIESIEAAGFRDDVIVATGTGLHSVTVSEHALGLILALVRRLPEVLEAQARHEWSRELGGAQPLHPAGRTTTLIDAKVLIWGFGDIGRTLAGHLSALGAHVRGVARSAGERDGFEVVEEGDVARLLPDTDILVGILPSTETTSKVIGADVLAALPERAFVINVGRGATLDQDALGAALRDGSIAGAGLDVTDPEPLPAEDPLWDAPNIIITPHGAGGRPVGASERIAHNLRALDGDRELLQRA